MSQLLITPSIATTPSDADLLENTASLLAAIPGSDLTQPLTDVIEYVCSIMAPEGRSRAARLELELAEYLLDGMMLLPEQVSPAGLDAWATWVPLLIIRARVAGCARCQRAGGDVR